MACARLIGKQRTGVHVLGEVQLKRESQGMNSLIIAYFKKCEMCETPP